MRTCLQCGARTDAFFCDQDGMATVVRGRQGKRDLEPGSLLAGRYRIVSELGRGGMGAVYEAVHTGTGQPVAVKTLLLDVDSEEAAVRRFFLEARITAGLQHPNTVRVFDFAQSDEGVLYLAMERLRGETLGERLRNLARQGRVLGEEEATSMAIAVLRSLAEAHAAGLVHRDLKPMNVFLHRIGSETVVKVIDFGIALAGDGGLTRTGVTVGTPAYMAPEQITQAHDLDGRADLYALGVMLYGCVTGRLPFSGATSYAIMMKHVSAPVPDARLLLRTPTSAPFLQVIERALAKDRDARYPDATAMREALEAAAAARAAGKCTIFPATCSDGTDILSDPTVGAASSTAPALRPLYYARWPVVVIVLLVVAALVAAVAWDNSARAQAGPRPATPVADQPPPVAPEQPGERPPVVPPAGPAAPRTPARPNRPAHDPALPRAPQQLAGAPVEAPPAPVATRTASSRDGPRAVTVDRGERPRKPRAAARPAAEPHAPTPFD